MKRNTIVIVEDDRASRDFFANMFMGKYKVAALATGKEALQYLIVNYKTIAIMLLKLELPIVDGKTLLKAMSGKGMLDKMPVIVLSDTNKTEDAIECYQLGAVDFISKPFVEEIVRRRVENIIELYMSKKALEQKIDVQTEKISEQNEKLEYFNEKLIETLSNIVEFRNLESTAHVRNIKNITRIIAECMKENYPIYDLTDDEIDIIVQASALHDIGKICIPDNILLKAGRLSEKEFELIKSHTTKGCEILSQMKDIQDEKYSEASRQICRHHHEKYDGSGYPDGLKGDEIPLSAQIVSIADVYDSLVSKRVYKNAYDVTKAYNMIMDGECGAFSSAILDCLSKSREKLEALYALTGQQDQNLS